ncbi:hypothetical protein MJK72_10795 [Klebsiella pneumoniae]|nr:hypothetical protein MJK72_10795 [Klebsiella pneumoniae]
MQSWLPLSRRKYVQLSRATAEIRRDTAFRLLCLNHTFTSLISTLGAHREKLTNPGILALLDDAVCYVDDALASYLRG